MTKHSIFVSTVVAPLVAMMALGPVALAQPAPGQPGGAGGQRNRGANRRAAPAQRNQPGAPQRTATPPAPGSPAVAAPTGTSPGSSELPGEKEFNQCRKLPAGKRIVKLNLKPDTEIIDLIGWISSITCAQFLYSSQTVLQGKKVTVISPDLITPEEAYRLFYLALDSVNLTVEPTGKFLRIVDSNKARSTTIPFYGPNQRAPADKRFITKLVRIDHLDANELNTAVLAKLKSDTGDIIPYRWSLMITDTAENVERMVAIIKQFDQPMAKEKIWMVKIRNASAMDMATRLSEIFPVHFVGTGGGGAGARRMGAPGAPPPAAPGAVPGGPQRPNPNGIPGDLSTEMTITKIIPDERSNSLLVIANERAYQWFLTLVRKLDTPIEGGGDGRVHVYYCEHANCDELATTLSAITGVAITGTGGMATRRRPTAGAQGAPAPMPAPPIAGAAGQQGQQTSFLFEGDVRITFDAPTNALLVMSSFKDFQSLRRVIEKLDAPRKQVFIEAMIMEVLLDKSRDVGVAYHGGKPVDVAGRESVLLGGFGASKTLNPAGLVSNLGGLTGALFGPALDATTSRLFGVSVDIPSFGAFLQLLQTNNDVNVLSNPSLLIMNNQEGEIVVGERLPFPGALLGGGGLPGQPGAGFGSLFPQVSVNREDVALKLKLIPSVNEHNIIRLEVEQEVSDVSSPNYNNLGPATSTRKTRTIVAARDQQTVVIGGLMTDRAADVVEKIPILGDIPVLGFFFRSTKKQMKKSNIIIAMTPYVITDLADLRRVAEKKMRERREFIERYSAIEDKAQFEAGLDFRRKRGMLEEINRTVREIEDEERELRAARESLMEGTDVTPIELPPQRGPEASAGGEEAPRMIPAAAANPVPSPAAVPAAPAAPAAPAPVPGVPAAAPAAPTVAPLQRR